MNAPRCQRWREGADHYRPAGEPIDPTRYGVALIDEATARTFVERQHYSGSYPAARVRVGLFRSRAWVTPELVGVAVFSVPMNQRCITKYAPGFRPSEGVELGRFVLLDDVPANGESWFLARAFKCLQVEKPGLRVVLSYSDPMQRVSLTGRVVTPGHVGTIYQASNARFVGRAESRWHHLDPSGRFVSQRALSKIRRDERGAAYAYRQLRAMGAPVRRLGEAGDAYVRRALRDGPFRRVKHPGNLAYLFALGSARRRRQIQRWFLPALPYPKADAERVLGGGAR